MKCLIVQPIHEEGLEMLRAAGVEPVRPTGTDGASLALAVRGCDAVITRDAGFPAAAFEGADRLQVVVVHGTGHDAVDKVAAASKGVLVANTPGANARSVAEHALGLMLAAARGIAGADAAERAGRTGFRESRDFAELEGKTALIVGWGAIGSRLGRMLDAAFGMRVLVHSPNAKDIGGFERAASLEAGLAEADVISLHTPMSPEKYHMINSARLALVKPGAVLVNVARAGLVDEAALAEAMATGRIAGAGLDVYSHDAPKGPLADHAVVFTPHLGATTEEALARVARGAAGHVLTALSGKLPETVLNPEVRSAAQ
ncbi:hydroxyacid dehydrogenase [Pseudooceanicola nanhaiensis]|uniref:hydroxyacid dehydrogenase n=1 Tax=Pseudooceanicola nanhaiensis TaxID=375761 RepID=UPI001CD581CD|nr:hydroxyacid dehydrogenase [Pseudooceanicola nanhaiensis]MCA0921563.1 hydroxyacid dehydrogenase [Pseudooceanicola nanhaiensis]